MGYHRAPDTNECRTGRHTPVGRSADGAKGRPGCLGRAGLGQERPDLGVDPGDSHDKGELSLCVGEAA